MKICIVQTKPIKGNIPANIDKHIQLINLSLTKGAEVVIFPELSITGFEPELASDLATSPEDSRFVKFQRLADMHKVIIGIGVPLQTDQGISISLLIFQAELAPISYNKKYLHSDEKAFFVSKDSDIGLIQKTIAFAICYEVFVPQHAIATKKKKASIYIASVAKSATGVAKAYQRLPIIAKTYNMTVLMSNCIGPCDNFIGGGKSAIWNDQGTLIGQLNDRSEGLLLIDTATEMVVHYRI